MVLKNLKCFKGWTLNISSEPSKNDILKIIDFVKKVETLYLKKTKHKNDEEILLYIKDLYLFDRCLDLASMIKTVWTNSDKLKLIWFPCDETSDPHAMIELDESFYDMKGEVNIQNLAEYLNKNYSQCAYSVTERKERLPTPPNRWSNYTCMEFILSLITIVDPVKNSSSLTI